MGFGANGGFDFTKELKKMLRKKMGFGANGGFALQKKESILRNRTNCEEKRQGLEPMLDLILLRN